MTSRNTALLAATILLCLFALVFNNDPQKYYAKYHDVGYMMQLGQTRVGDQYSIGWPLEMAIVENRVTHNRSPVERHFRWNVAAAVYNGIFSFLLIAPILLCGYAGWMPKLDRRIHFGTIFDMVSAICILLAAIGLAQELGLDLQQLCRNPMCFLLLPGAFCFFRSLRKSIETLQKRAANRTQEEAEQRDKLEVAEP